MRGFVWLGLGVLLLLAWAISCLVFRVAGVLIHLLLMFALISLMIYAFIGKRSRINGWLCPFRNCALAGPGEWR
jgi:hypothetical protein